MRKNQTKDKIVSTFISMMAQNKLEDIYVKDIALKANITRQTFYRHFKDKYDVINWYYDQEIEALFIQTFTIEGLRRNLIIKLRKFKKEMPLYRNAYSYTGQNSLSKHEFKRMSESLLIKANHQCSNTPEAPPNTLKYAIDFFCHGIIEMSIDWLNQSCPISCESFAEILIDLMPADLRVKIEENHS